METSPTSTKTSPSGSQTLKVVVATTVALSFISYWRGAAIVLSDLASSMFYAGGIAEQAIGPSAAWYVLGVMVFSFAVRSVYMESCGMFVRGGVYVVVKDSMGPFIARLSVSSLVFDYVLTGPISVVSAGQYLGALINEVAGFAHHSEIHVNPNYFAAVFGVLVTTYFWWSNIKGIQESSSAALRIMQITTVMVIMLLIWCPLTIVLQGKWHLPPSPVPSHLVFNDTSTGFLKGTVWPTIPIVAVIIAFGHSLLSMSGFETLAQVYREIAS
ncbi:MAG: APC family permease, partial [Acidobacteriaceae bacterium]|nr:APC family permease [Acidobacteriaceae bacterium]